jgi:glucose-1-phosphate thymidylyltransferase
MILASATKLCFVISPGKSDIVEYYGGNVGSAHVCYTVQPRPTGLCDAIFCALPLIQPEDLVIVGLPDTIWFPETALCSVDNDCLSFLLFPVERPEFFDAVVLDENERLLEIQVKQPTPKSNWIWGAFKMPGSVLHDLYHLWCERDRRDEYIGTLINAYLAKGGEAWGVCAGELYADVGTLNGYREALQVLSARPQSNGPCDVHPPKRRESARRQAAMESGVSTFS